MLKQLHLLRPSLKNVQISANICLRHTEAFTLSRGVGHSRFINSVSAADLQFGQPVHETHPHLIKAGDVTPGISALEYSGRRSKLASNLPKNAIAIIPTSSVKYRSGSVFYEFHQDSNFLYFTGFNEPEAVAVIANNADDNDHIFYLFVRPKDPKAEQWDGSRSGLDAARDIFNADEIGDVYQLESLLSPIISASSSIYTDIPLDPEPKSVVSRFFFGSLAKKDGLDKIIGSTSVRPLKPLINELRSIKSDAEVANMRRAGQASGRAFTEAMRQSWTREKDLWTFMDYKFKNLGCDTSAYVPVVAGGKNALKIHYVRNDSILSNNDLVLVDAGGEYGSYITDITRTFPVNRRFTRAQSDLYNAIISVQRTCISLCRANATTTLNHLHDLAEKHLTTNLLDLGFDMSGRALETLLPHHLGHYIGLDIHDTPGYSRAEVLRPGHCVTIEPGIYVPDEDRWPKHFRGMGIRIEDSIAVGEEHPLVLTTEAVKEVVDIEALRS